MWKIYFKNEGLERTSISPTSASAFLNRDTAPVQSSKKQTSLNEEVINLNGFCRKNKEEIPAVHSSEVQCFSDRVSRLGRNFKAVNTFLDP